MTFSFYQGRKENLGGISEKEVVVPSITKNCKEETGKKTGAPVMFGHGQAIGAQTGLLGFFRKQAGSVLESSWQIIQV